MNAEKVLFTTSVYPFPTLPNDTSLTDATGARFSRADGIFCIISHSHSFADPPPRPEHQRPCRRPRIPEVGRFHGRDREGLFRRRHQRPARPPGRRPQDVPARPRAFAADEDRPGGLRRDGPHGHHGRTGMEAIRGRDLSRRRRPVHAPPVRRKGGRADPAEADAQRRRVSAVHHPFPQGGDRLPRLRLGLPRHVRLLLEHGALRPHPDHHALARGPGPRHGPRITRPSPTCPASSSSTRTTSAGPTT